MKNTDVEITTAFEDDIMASVRVKTNGARVEIRDMIDACLMDLERCGILISEIDKQVKQAIKLYCKAFYGYDDNTDRFKVAYEALRDAMALSTDYIKREGEENG